MDGTEWPIFYENAAYLQSHIQLPTLLANLQRKEILTTEDCERLLSEEKETQIVHLLDVLNDRLSGNVERLCEAIKETNPEVLVNIGINLDSDSTNSSQEPNHILRSYLAVLNISTKPLQHLTDNYLRDPVCNHAVFL